MLPGGLSVATASVAIHKYTAVSCSANEHSQLIAVITVFSGLKVATFSTLSFTDQEASHALGCLLLGLWLAVPIS